MSSKALSAVFLGKAEKTFMTGEHSDFRVNVLLFQDFKEKKAITGMQYLRFHKFESQNCMYIAGSK